MTADGGLITWGGRGLRQRTGGLLVCVSVFFYESDSFIF